MLTSLIHGHISLKRMQTFLRKKMWSIDLEQLVNFYKSTKLEDIEEHLQVK